MNIFATSPCPMQAAKNLDDKRVVKMILETAQLLCTALSESGLKTPYRSTHKSHPAALWARASRDNFKWLITHGLALCEVYKQAYGRTHKSQDVIKWCATHITHVKAGPLTQFSNCAANKSLNIDFKSEVDPVKAYRSYMQVRWQTDKRPPTWTGRETPKWYTISEHRRVS